MADDYDHGKRDGRRLALAILAAAEAKWAATLGGSGSWRTNLSRDVRYKTLRVAQTRIRTALNRAAPKTDAKVEAELTAALDKLGL